MLGVCLDHSPSGPGSSEHPSPQSVCPNVHCGDVLCSNLSGFTSDALCPNLWRLRSQTRFSWMHPLVLSLLRIVELELKSNAKNPCDFFLYWNTNKKLKAKEKKKRRRRKKKKKREREKEEVQSTVALRPQRPWGLYGTGSPGRPPRLSHSSWALG